MSPQRILFHFFFNSGVERSKFMLKKNPTRDKNCVTPVHKEIKQRIETVCTTFYSHTHNHASISFEPLCYNLHWHSYLWAECVSMKINQYWQILHADGSPSIHCSWCQELFFPMNDNKTMTKEFDFLTI